MKKLLIGIPSYSGLFSTETVESLLKLKKSIPTMIQIVERQRIDKSRNYMVQMALESGSDYLLFIDDDNPVPENTIELLLENDKDIICVPIPTRCPNKDGFHDLCIFKDKYVGDINVYENINKIDLSNGYLIEVDACGMGCTLIKKEVLEKMWKEYNGEPFSFGDTTYVVTEGDINKNRRTMGEDAEFCERAKKMGFKIYCDTRIRPYHLGKQMRYKFNDNYII